MEGGRDGGRWGRGREEGRGGRENRNVKVLIAKGTADSGTVPGFSPGCIPHLLTHTHSVCLRYV